MRWRLLFALIGLSITGVSSVAQIPPRAERLAPGSAGSQIGEPHAGFLGQAGVVRFQLVQGRICLDSPRHRKGSQSRDEPGIYESIAVTATRGIPSVHYVCQTAVQHVALSVQNADLLRIDSWLPSTTQRCVIEQPHSGAISWLIQSGDQATTYQAPSLIHLRLTDPDCFDHHFGYLVQRMLRGQSLDQISIETVRASLDEASTAPTLTLARTHSLIDGLGDERRTVRVHSQNQLIAAGTTILPTLWTIDRSELDAEQNRRLRVIQAAVSTGAPDRPRTLAKIFVNDADYWTRVQSKLTTDQRKLAAKRLGQFGVEVAWNDTASLDQLAENGDLPSFVD